MRLRDCPELRDQIKQMASAVFNDEVLVHAHSGSLLPGCLRAFADASCLFWAAPKTLEDTDDEVATDLADYCELLRGAEPPSAFVTVSLPVPFSTLDERSDKPLSVLCHSPALQRATGARPALKITGLWKDFDRARDTLSPGQWRVSFLVRKEVAAHPKTRYVLQTTNRELGEFGPADATVRNVAPRLPRYTPPAAAAGLVRITHLSESVKDFRIQIALPVTWWQAFEEGGVLQAEPGAATLDRISLRVSPAAGGGAADDLRFDVDFSCPIDVPAMRKKLNPAQKTLAIILPKGTYPLSSSARCDTWANDTTVFCANDMSEQELGAAAGLQMDKEVQLPQFHIIAGPYLRTGGWASVFLGVVIASKQSRLRTKVCCTGQ